MENCQTTFVLVFCGVVFFIILTTAMKMSGESWIKILKLWSVIICILSVVVGFILFAFWLSQFICC